MKRISLLLLSILSIQACSIDSKTSVQSNISPTAPAIACEDLLGKWKKKPNELKFSNCKYKKHAQVDRLVSTYVVKGTDAAIIERFLRKEFRMSPLRFVCCGWEPVVVGNGQTINNPRYGIYQDRDGYDCEISMTSGETLEQNWHLIPEFYIYVTKYLGDP
jgi:Domian of unknown function (DUF4952)